MSQHGQLNTIKKDPSKGKDEHLYKVSAMKKQQK